MSLFNIKFNARKSVFQDDRIIEKFANASRRVLNKFGAFVRRRAKSSIRARKRASTPGAAPSKHTGLLRDLIVFNVDRSPNNVVIGPLQTNKVSHIGPNLTPVTGTVPEVLEDGGELWIVEEFVRGHSPAARVTPQGYGAWMRVDLRRRGSKFKRFQARIGTNTGQVRKRRIKVRPRPFMVPAFDHVVDRELDKIWAKSLK